MLCYCGGWWHVEKCHPVINLTVFETSLIFTVDHGTPRWRISEARDLDLKL